MSYEVKGGRPPKLTELQMHQLRDWYYQPRTIKEMAKKLGVSQSTVKNYIHGFIKRYEGKGHTG